uniref:Uncharacterized protein n=1 Tax=Glossina pallidipes TaxID=7398 RepID=A0A1A9ZVL0_GLOPL
MHDLLPKEDNDLKPDASMHGAFITCLSIFYVLDIRPQSKIEKKDKDLQFNNNNKIYLILLAVRNELILRNIFSFFVKFVKKGKFCFSNTIAWAPYNLSGAVEALKETPNFSLARINGGSMNVCNVDEPKILKRRLEIKSIAAGTRALSFLSTNENERVDII